MAADACPTIWSSTMTFCQIRCDRPEHSPSTWSAADTVGPSGKSCTYNAATLLMIDNNSLQ